MERPRGTWPSASRTPHTTRVLRIFRRPGGRRTAPVGSMPAPPELLVPVGQGIGAFHRPWPGVTRAAQQVRVGVHIADLSDREFVVWTLAHGLIDEQGRPQACTTAGLLGYVDDRYALRSLIYRGLLAVVTPGTAESVRFAASHRLLPLAMGLGNTAEEPELFSVGLPHEPALQMTGPLFDMWQWAHLSPSLWSACIETADVARGAGIGDPALIDPEQVLVRVLSAVPGMLAARVACLDVRIEGLR